MEIQDPWFSYLVTGQKKVEGRKANEKWSRLEAGDVIFVSCPGQESRLFQITRVSVSFSTKGGKKDQYLITEGLRNCLPGVISLEEAKQVHHKLNPPEELAKYKFLGIEMKCID